ncbi:RBBP9/YdeN family alpha/beta hydrolase [Sphingomonas sp. ID0503]|uniref:RBBP9/YdeN family alpha/beta hydrolase n=1 Tax=Sphingomonas sp. ID0503 TaxID=3399691 RepID=UPI003AFA7A2F
MAVTCLIVPGLMGSGPDHWQSRWEAERDDCRRVDLGCWDRPRRDIWVEALDRAVAASRRPVIVAHSLGCHAVAWWARLAGARAGKVAGALLVAPPSVDRASCDHRLTRFAPTADIILPFEARLIASRDDPYATIEEAGDMADRWGAELVDLGALGHINAKSGLGSWPAGQAMLDQLIRRCGGLSTTADITTGIRA